MTQHTPGPWAIAPFSRGGDIIETKAITDEDYPYLIACPGSGGAMSYSSTVCQMHWRSTPEWDANAHLIAAAPELLDSLKDAVAPFAGDQSPPRWVVIAHAIIAKAEGRTP